MIFFSLDLIRRQSLTKKKKKSGQIQQVLEFAVYKIYTRKNEVIIFGRLYNHLAVYIYFLKEKKYLKVDWNELLLKKKKKRWHTLIFWCFVMHMYLQPWLLDSKNLVLLPLPVNWNGTEVGMGLTIPCNAWVKDFEQGRWCFLIAVGLLKQVP